MAAALIGAPAVGCGTFLIDGAPCVDNGGCPTPLVCRAEQCAQPIVREGLGWLAYISDVTGAAEVWIAVDDGSHRVRVTEGLSSASGEAAGPTFSWDGRFIAVQSNIEPGGAVGDRHIWRVRPDGSDARPLVPTGGQAMSRLSWEGDSQHLHYTFEANCSSDLRRIDAIAGSAPEVVYAVLEIASDPSVNPADASTVLFNAQTCSQVGHLALLDRDDGSVTSVPSGEAVRATAWAPDGSRFAFSDSGGIFEHDLVTRTLAYDAPGELLSAPVYDDAGRLLAIRGAGLDAEVIRVEVGVAAVVGTFDLATSGGLSWGRVADDPDRDNDGVANGIDPTPDGG